MIKNITLTFIEISDPNQISNFRAESERDEK